MTFEEYALARQYVTEMRLGTALRQQRAREDALAKKGREAIEKQERRGTRGDG